VIKDLSTVWTVEESPGGSPVWIRGYGGHQLLRYYRVRKVEVDVFGAYWVLVQWCKNVFKAEKDSHSDVAVLRLGTRPYNDGVSVLIDALYAQHLIAFLGDISLVFRNGGASVPREDLV
jgi:hypothetical protein